MAIDVAKVIIESVQDASGLAEPLRAGRFLADEVIAVIGKTEGNGGVNDFTRILSDQAFREVLRRDGTRTEGWDFTASDRSEITLFGGACARATDTGGDVVATILCDE